MPSVYCIFRNHILKLYADFIQKLVALFLAIQITGQTDIFSYEVHNLRRDMKKGAAMVTTCLRLTLSKLNTASGWPIIKSQMGSSKQSNITSQYMSIIHQNLWIRRTMQNTR
uniref:Uncharacterized protein n=1 Tax=Arundo donax TaxID=35708 RepID=A0A0A9S438_ARUDO